MSITDWTLTVNRDVIDVPPFDGLLALTSAPTDSPRWPRCRPGVARYTLAFTGHDGWAETWSVTRATAVAVHRAAATSADYPTGEQVYAMLSTAPAEPPEPAHEVRARLVEAFGKAERAAVTATLSPDAAYRRWLRRGGWDV